MVRQTYKLYVEGGGDAHNLHAECRKGFSCFLEKAGFKGCMPRIIACGGRQSAYDSFQAACQNNEKAFLLVDSEDPVNTQSPWSHLKARDNFDKPQGASDEQCGLMVVVMESWFLADQAALSAFFKSGFNQTALPQNPSIENIPKKDVYKALQNATAHCEKKAPYRKGAHSFKILEKIDPQKVRTASKWAKTFLTNLEAFMKT